MSCYASIVVYVIVVALYLYCAYTVLTPVRAVNGLHNGIVYGYGQKQYPARVPKAPYAAHAKEGYGDQ